MVEPVEIMAATTLGWVRSLSDYKSPTWALTYYATSNRQTIQITTSPDGNGNFVVSVPSATTRQYGPGVYAWQAFVTQAGERYLADTGTWTVLESFVDAPATGYDTRTPAEQVLDELYSLAQAGAVGGSSFTIGEYSESVDSPEELQQRIDYWQAKVVEERRKKRVIEGRRHNGRIMEIMQ